MVGIYIITRNWNNLFLKWKIPTSQGIVIFKNCFLVSLYLQKGDGHSSRDYKTVRIKEDISESFNFFIDGDPVIQTKYIRRLKAIRATLESSEFFAVHEVQLFVKVTQLELSHRLCSTRVKAVSDQIPQNIHVEAANIKLADFHWFVLHVKPILTYYYTVL